MKTDNKRAPSGQIYVCGACGKRSYDKYGEYKIDPMWDTSCMINAILCYEESYRKDENGIYADAVKEEH